MTAVRERLVALLLVAAGALMLVASLPATWVVVPSQFTRQLGPVPLDGLIVFEDGVLHALLAAALLVGLWRWDDWRRTTVAVVLVLLCLVWLGQALERAVRPGNAAASADEGPVRLGIDGPEGRQSLNRLAEADLPATGWPWLAVTGSLVTTSGAVLVLARSRRWEPTAAGDRDWWSS